MAQDLKVSLILDDTQYTGKITAAGKAADDLGNKVKKAGNDGGEGFGRLISSAESLKGKMETLTTVLLGAGFVEVAHRALDLADQIVDLSHGTDVGIARILALRAAFEANGGSAEGLGKLLNKMNISLFDAQEGGAQAQEALMKLGFTLADMGNLGTDEAFSKVIAKLGAMEDPVARNALAFKTLGKEAKNIDWAGVEEALARGETDFTGYAAAIEQAGRAHDKLAEAGNKLLIAFTGLLESIGALDLINNASDNMAKFEKVVYAAGAAFALYFGSKAVVMAMEFVQAIYAIEKAVLALFAAEQLLEKGTVIGRIAMLVTGIAAAAAAYLGFDAIMKKADDDAAARTAAAARRDFAKNDPRRVKTDTGGDASGGKTTPLAAWAKEIEQINQLSDAYARTNKDLVDRIKLETQIIGVSADSAKATQALAEMDKSYNKQIEDINNRIKQEQLSTGGDAAKAAKLAQLAKEKDEITALYTAQRQQLDAELTANAAVTEQLRKKNQQYEEQYNFQLRLNKVQDEYNKVGLTDTQKKIYDVKAAARDAADTQIRDEEKLLGYKMNANGELTKIRLSKERKDAIIADRKAEADAEEELIKKNEESARRFDTGWKNAYASYADNATNAAKQAEQIFNKAMSGMEDLIVNFAKTGKFEWKTFVASMTEELLRSQVKQLLANLFSPAGAGGGGIMGAIGSLFGLGGGSGKGDSPTNAMWVRSADGGGLGGGLGGAAQGGGIFDSVKKLFGGISDSVGSVFSGIGDTIGSIFGGGGGGGGGGGLLSSIGDFFGGFFANGGTLGAGQVGIAGEAGPELISGPATVTPLGGAQNVTYNINAVDAASFKAMIAADPSFIHGVAMKGAAGIPARR